MTAPIIGAVILFMDAQGIEVYHVRLVQSAEDGIAHKRDIIHHILIILQSFTFIKNVNGLKLQLRLQEGKRALRLAFPL